MPVSAVVFAALTWMGCSGDGDAPPSESTSPMGADAGTADEAADPQLPPLPADLAGGRLRVERFDLMVDDALYYPVVDRQIAEWASCVEAAAPACGMWALRVERNRHRGNITVGWSEDSLSAESLEACLLASIRHPPARRPAEASPEWGYRTRLVIAPDASQLDGCGRGAEQ